MNRQYLLASITLSGIEQVVVLLTLIGTIGSFILWANSKQDGLVSRFVEIDARHFKLRARLALSFQKIAYTLRSIDTRLSDLENHEENNSSFKKRKRPRESELQNKGIEFWNETSLDDETQIPFDKTED